MKYFIGINQEYIPMQLAELEAANSYPIICQDIIFTRSLFNVRAFIKAITVSVYTIYGSLNKQELVKYYFGALHQNLDISKFLQLHNCVFT